ncbi:MAG: MarR family winged helix-turn-helix transcriptional regulator, partial [Advenella sp.]
RAGISKQAVGKLLKDLEDASLVTRSQDESDGRAQIIFFTDAGVDYLQQIHASIKSIEQEYEAILGKQEVENLRSSLSKLAYAENAPPK